MKPLTQFRIKTFICILAFLFAIQACKKEKNPPPSSPAQSGGGGGSLVYTVVDMETLMPIGDVSVHLEYGNSFSADKVTDANGKAYFDVPYGWVLNKITAIKDGYCHYQDSPNTINYPYNQTVKLGKYARIRMQLNNVGSAYATDKIVVNFSGPFLNAMQFSYTGMVGTQFISICKAGYLNISCDIYSETVLVNKITTSAYATGGDTTDVTINY